MARDRLMDSIENLADFQDDMRQKIKRLESEKADLLEALDQLAYLTWESTGTYPEQWEQAYGDYQAAIAKARPATLDTTKRGSRRRFGGHPPRQAQPTGGA